MNKLFIAALAAAVCMGSIAQASIQFSQAELGDMTIDVARTSPNFNLFPGTGILTKNPPGVYEDGDSPMSGLAGATGSLTVTGSTAYYGLTASDLASLNTALGAAGDFLSSRVFNDNDDLWSVGIWYDLGAGPVTSLAVVNPNGGSEFVSLFVPGGNSVIAAGVAVSLPAGGRTTDTFHASWGVPEPGSFLVWGALGLISLAAGRRNRG